MKIRDILKQEWECQCLGCSIVSGAISPPGGLILDAEHFVLHQDPEIPIRAFLIVASKKHIQSISQLQAGEAHELFDLIYKARLVMGEIGVKEVTIIQEERSSHFHLWLLPRYEWMNHQYTNSLATIRAMFSDIKENRCSSEIVEEILFTANLIKQKLSYLPN